MTKIRITLDIHENHLKLIDEAAKKDFTSRNQLMVKAATKMAYEILSED